MAPEAHFITGFDAEFVAQFLGNHDLSLGPDAVSHTSEYNPGSDVGGDGWPASRGEVARAPAQADWMIGTPALEIVGVPEAVQSGTSGAVGAYLCAARELSVMSYACRIRVVGVGALVGCLLTLALASCSDSTSTTPTSLTSSTAVGHPPSEVDVPEQVQRVADAAGCEVLRSGSSYLFGDRSDRYVCAVQNADIALIHRFPVDQRPSAMAYFSARTDVAELNPCPDGSRHPGPWIVVGSTWAASSYDERRMRAVADEVGGEFVGGGSRSDDLPIGPPASYMVPGYCDA